MDSQGSLVEDIVPCKVVNRNEIALDASAGEFKKRTKSSGTPRPRDKYVRRVCCFWDKIL